MSVKGVSSTVPHILIHILDSNNNLVEERRLGISSSGFDTVLFQTSFAIDSLNLNIEFDEKSFNPSNFNTELQNKEDTIVVSSTERNVFNLINNIFEEEQEIGFTDFATKEYVDSENFTKVFNTTGSLNPANQFPNNTLIVVNSSFTRTVTINNDGPIGTMYTIYRRGSGTVNVNGSGITLVPGNRAVSFRYRAISVIKIATST
jgi:hypothetical protein